MRGLIGAVITIRNLAVEEVADFSAFQPVEQRNTEASRS